MKKREIFYLHVGAHRTGSSSFQLCLHQNRELLDSQQYGASFPSRDGIKAGELALRLPAPRHKVKDVEAFCTRMKRHLNDPRVVGARKNVILSDENILGSMVHFERGRFYPAAEKRFSVLRAALSSPPKNIILVVREYSSFFRSCYRKRAEDNWVKPFGEVIPNLMNMDRGWYEIVLALREKLNPEEITIVDYASRGSSSSLLQKLVPDLKNVSLQEPLQSLNVGATDAALSVLQEQHLKEEKTTKKQRATIINQYADQNSDQGFSEYSELEISALASRWQCDLERLSEISNVSMRS